MTKLEAKSWCSEDGFPHWVNHYHISVTAKSNTRAMTVCVTGKSTRAAIVTDDVPGRLKTATGSTADKIYLP
jgi:hypothetical protein